MFPAKILLFGEYSVLAGSEALAIPYREYSGQLMVGEKNEASIKSNVTLLALYEYLKKKKKEMPFNFDFDGFLKSIEQGEYFNSTIPHSYGLGSSGALVAAVYHKYADNAISRVCEQHDLPELKQHLSFIENFFHGTSSGIDPLVSYLNRAIYTKQGEVSFSEEINFNNISPFLIDTKQKSNTSEYIKLYHELLQKTDFSYLIEHEAFKYVKYAIKYSANHHESNLLNAIRQLSILTFTLFKPMIPGDYIKHFEYGINQKMFYLKLCGSGGGGYLMGFTANYNETVNYFKSNSIIIMPFNI